MERFAIPGVSVGICRGSEHEVAGFGVTSVENPLPVDGDTLFQIGSITKTYTATAALRLVEQGHLELDEPVRTYLPDLRLADEQAATNVTMRHLLSHTGGWTGDYFDLLGPGDDALALMVERLDRLEQLTPLGEVWSYNNAGFYIAGRVIEVVTGKPFEVALSELVLAPLGLERSFFFADDVLTHRFAVGHDLSGAVARPWGIGRAAAPVGGLVASVRELLAYARLQWEPGVLTQGSLDAMRVPHAEVSLALGDSFGLGWFLSERDSRSFLTHGGATNGQQALLVVCPRERLALAVLTNHDNGSALYMELRTEVLRSELGIEPLPDPTVELSQAELAEYAGEYDSVLYLARLSTSDHGLVLDVIPKGGFPTPDSPPTPGPPPTRLAFEAADAVIALDPPMTGERSEFLRGPDGRIAWYRCGGRLLRPIRAAD